MDKKDYREIDEIDHILEHDVDVGELRSKIHLSAYLSTEQKMKLEA